MRCLIIDDEPRAHVVLQHYIRSLDGIELAGHAYNVIDGYNILKANAVDLIFLDINMPEFDGFSLLDMLERKPLVIFVTAYTKFAFQGFEYGAVDYLHKPIRFERFVKSIEKAKRLFDRTGEKITSISLRIDSTTQEIQLSDLLYIESVGNYCKLFLKNKQFITHITLKELEDALPQPIFVRTHKSYIVNLALTKVYESNLEIDGMVLPIGRTYKRYILEYAKRT